MRKKLPIPAVFEGPPSLFERAAPDKTAPRALRNPPRRILHMPGIADDADADGILAATNPQTD